MHYQQPHTLYRVRNTYYTIITIIICSLGKKSVFLHNKKDDVCCLHDLHGTAFSLFLLLLSFFCFPSFYLSSSHLIISLLPIVFLHYFLTTPFYAGRAFLPNKNKIKARFQILLSLFSLSSACLPPTLFLLCSEP